MVVLGKKRLCDSEEMIYFQKNYNQPYSYWKDNKSLFYDSFFTACFYIGPIQNESSFVITDKLFVDLLINALTEDDIQIAKRAAGFILSNTSYSAIKERSDNLKKKLYRSKLAYDYKTKLFALTSLNTEEVDSIINNKDTPLVVKAKLGLDSAEKIIIKNYETSKDFREKKSAISELMFVGTRGVIKRFWKISMNHC